MSFLLLKLVSPRSPSTGIWAIYKSPCKLFCHRTSWLRLLATVFSGQAVPFLHPPTPWRPPTLHGLVEVALIKAIACYLF